VPCPPQLYLVLVVLIHFHDHQIYLSTTKAQLARLLR